MRWPPNPELLTRVSESEAMGPERGGAADAAGARGEAWALGDTPILAAASAALVGRMSACSVWVVRPVGGLGLSEPALLLRDHAELM